jgi:hypothetical protein
VENKLVWHAAHCRFLARETNLFFFFFVCFGGIEQGRSALFVIGFEGGTRIVLVFNVFLCMCYVAFSTTLFVDVLLVIVLSFGVATGVTTLL